MSRQRHAVVKKSPVVINGHVVGESMEIEYAKGAPEWRLCDWEACPTQANNETLTGLQFCNEHFNAFYSSVPYKPRRVPYVCSHGLGPDQQCQSCDAEIAP